MSQGNEGVSIDVQKKMWFSILDGFSTTEQININQIVLEKFFTVLKIDGDTVTLKLADELGGAVFTLTERWKEMGTGDLFHMARVYDQVPHHIRETIGKFVAGNLPGATTPPPVVPSLEALRNTIDVSKVTPNDVVVDHNGRMITVAGKFFRIDGFMMALGTNIAIKLLFRAMNDRESLKKKETYYLDVGTGTAACVAVWIVKFFMALFFLYPPVLATYVASAIAGIAAAKVVKDVIEEK